MHGSLYSTHRVSAPHSLWSKQRLSGCQKVSRCQAIRRHLVSSVPLLSIVEALQREAQLWGADAGYYAEQGHDKLTETAESLGLPSGKKTPAAEASQWIDPQLSKVCSFCLH